jgi:solute carrier family 8 (sodium/calcium exchanger)
VTIIDNDHGGVFAFEREMYDVTDYTGHASVTVIRGRGARGKVLLPYKTLEGTASAVTDYKHTQGMLAFENEQSEYVPNVCFVNTPALRAHIRVAISCEAVSEKQRTFYVQLGPPIWFKNDGGK